MPNLGEIKSFCFNGTKAKVAHCGTAFLQNGFMAGENNVFLIQSLSERGLNISRKVMQQDDNMQSSPVSWPMSGSQDAAISAIQII